jgi:hypothetical protein
MRERLETRLAELKAEFERGQKTLEELEARVNSVRTVMLRLSGAIQVLEEELARAGAPDSETPRTPPALLQVPAGGAGDVR